MKAKKYFSALMVWLSMCSVYAQYLDVYKLQLFENGKDTMVFTSLSESYALGDHPDSTLPDLKGKKIEEVQYFPLGAEYRKRFLAGTGIDEWDKVWIYDYVTDKNASFFVKDLDVIAFISPYITEDDFPFSAYDYQIGFNIDKYMLKGFSDIYYPSGLVAVGHDNPFQSGKMKPLKWEKCELEELDAEIVQTLDGALISEGYKNFKVQNTYTCVSDGFQFFIQRIHLKKGDLMVENLLVIDKKTNKTVCDKLYFEEEGIEHTPLNKFGPGYSSADVYQWAGKLFRDKPPVVFGFEFYSFSCPDILFLDPNEPNLFLKCDNRH